MAVATDASIVAEVALDEALAIHLETLSFSTSAKNLVSRLFFSERKFIHFVLNSVLLG